MEIRIQMLSIYFSSTQLRQLALLLIGIIKLASKTINFQLNLLSRSACLRTGI